MTYVRVSRFGLNDGAIGGVIEKANKEQLHVRITYARTERSKVRADKGVNLPNSTLRLPSLTEKDLDDLQFIGTHADLVGYSFVKSATDVQELQKQLALLGGKDLGIVLKIETRHAFEQLANVLLAAMTQWVCILQRMENHQSKKRSMLRHLRLADRLSY